MNMDQDTKFFIKMIGCFVLVFLMLILGIAIPTADYGDTEALVKIQEVGIHYAWFNFGEQNYIRVQNAYSDSYSASSESWETCIDTRDIKTFIDAKNNRTTLNIRVKGNGLSTRFNCLTGDKVVEIK
jgi:hypothetical protein